MKHFRLWLAAALAVCLAAAFLGSLISAQPSSAMTVSGSPADDSGAAQPTRVSSPPKPAPDSAWAKVSSSLQQAGQSALGLAAGADPAQLSSDLVRVNGQGHVQVDVWLLDTSSATLDALQAAGLVVQRSDPAFSVIEGWLPLQSLEAVAAMPEVRLVSPPSYPYVDTGSVNSEGDAIHRANLVRSELGINGAGIKVCVLSDGVNHWLNASASGDLPAAIDIRKAGNGDEGTAMLEIIYDLAPGAMLGFYGPETAVDMAAGIRSLRDSGCRVIVDDLSFNDQPYYEPGVIFRAIEEVMWNSDVVYAGSAGNVALAHWQGNFVAGYPTWCNYGLAHRWSGSDETMDIVIANGGRLNVFLQWNDQWGHSGNDYDLFLYDSAMSMFLAVSNASQNGAGDPIEAISYLNTTGAPRLTRLVICRASGNSPAPLQVFSRGTGIVSREYNVVAGSVTPNHHVPGMFTSAAISASDPGNDTIESFSSQGPVVHYYPRYEVLDKPDISGIDGVHVTGAGGFSSPFFGTSAAAPHIAAIAALLRSANPGLSQSSIYDAIADTAVDLGTPGYDHTFGYGRADAFAAARRIADAATPTPSRTGTPTRTRTPMSTPTHTPIRNPILEVQPTQLAFLASPILNPQEYTVTVYNNGTGSLSWNATKTAAWLIVSPATGNASNGAPGYFTVRVNSDGLPFGVHETAITVMSSTPGVLGSPQIIGVRFSYQGILRFTSLPVIFKNYAPGGGSASATATATRTATPGGGSSPTATRTATPGTGWTTIINESFEGAFPGDWEVADYSGSTSSEYFWARRNCRPFSGGYSGWATGGGADGAGLTCGAAYPANAYSWMVYGPFSLSGATGADLRFKLWLNSEQDYDGQCWGASTNGVDFSVACSTGDTAGWVDRVLDLGDVPTLGSLLGQPAVWIGLVFVSDSSAQYPEGAYVDNIELRRCSGSCPAAAAGAADTGGEVQRQLKLHQ